MFIRRHRLAALSGLAVASVAGVLIHQSTSPADAAAVPTYAGSCWIDAIGDMPDETSTFAKTPQGAITRAAANAAAAQVNAIAKGAINPAQRAETDFLARLKLSTPSERSLVAETSQTITDQSEATVWVSRRANGDIDGTAVVVDIGSQRYAVMEKHFALPDSVDCTKSQLW
jgi:hypothetical protein